MHLAFLGDESRYAAEASECADDQGKFWEYYDKLFANEKGENQGAFTKDNLKKFAADLKLDTAKFNTCLDDGKFTKIVSDETTLVGSNGVNSTPTFFINGQKVAGAQSIDAFSKIIDAEKAKKK